MVFKPGHQHGRKPRLFEQALRMELADCGDDLKGLRSIARAMINKARDGDMGAIKELADRVDGKVAQAVHTGQDPDAEPMAITYDAQDVTRRLRILMAEMTTEPAPVIVDRTDQERE